MNVICEREIWFFDEPKPKIKKPEHDNAKMLMFLRGYDEDDQLMPSLGWSSTDIIFDAPKHLHKKKAFVMELK